MCSMIDSNQPTEFITEWDLALFAEDALAPARHQQVAEFLAEHPELAALVGKETQSGSGHYPEHPSKNMDSHSAEDQLRDSSLSGQSEDVTRRRPQRRETIDSESVLDLKPTRAAEPSKSGLGVKLKRLLTTVNLLAALLVVSSGIGLFAKTKAASPVLREIERSFKDGTLDSELNTLMQARIKLEGIDPLFLSSQDRQLYQYLMAMVLLGQAESELVANRPVIYSGRVPSQPPLTELTRNAIDRLTELLPYRPELQAELARAWHLHGRILFRFAVTHRRNRRDDSVPVCGAFLKALELMPERMPERWRIASHLLKAIYKLTPKQLDRRSAAFLDDITGVFPDIQIDSAQPCQSAILQLAEVIQRQPPDSDPIRVAHVEVASILTMASMYGLKNASIPGTTRQTLKMAEVSREQASDEFLLAYGQLLGNLADSRRHVDLTEARRFGRQAHEVLRQLVQDNRSDEILTELGWVTARLLISEYRYSRQHPEEQNNVRELIGALRQTEISLKHFGTLQLASWEIDVINAIEAEISGEESQAPGAKRILESYRAKRLSPSVIELLRSDLAHLQALQNSADFRTFLSLQANDD